ncbi:MAG: TatD family hydrolase [Candidatus Spyradosoma sp.]
MNFDAHAHLPEGGAEGVSATWRGVVCAVRAEDFPKLAALAAAREGVVPAFGVHPWFAETFGAETLAALRRFLETAPRAQVGEIGLDGARAGVAPLAVQREVFARQLALAAEKGVPAHVHCVRAWGELTAALRGAKRLPPRLHFHAFSGSAETARELTRLADATFSFSPAQLARRTPKLERVLAALPRERLLEESDAPADAR